MRDRHAGEQGRERQAVLVQKNQQNKGFLLVPAERIELPTNGLQNVCGGTIPDSSCADISGTSFIFSLS